jgi:hypothetical protein
MTRTFKRQSLVVGQQRFERFDVHIHLALVVHGAARVEVAIALGRLKRRREPFVQRIGRLNVIVSIQQRGWLAGGMKPVGIDQRMTGFFRASGLDQPNVLHADARQFRGQHLGGMASIAIVLG